MKLYESKLETKPMKWKNQVIPNYYVRNDGVVFEHGTPMYTWLNNGRKYVKVNIDNHLWSYRVDYIVAYTFKPFYEDAIRLIHVNGDNSDDRVDNLMWFRKLDILEKYRDLAIIEPDGSIKEQWRPCRTEFNLSLDYEVSNLGDVRDKDHNPVKIFDTHGYKVFYYPECHTKNTKLKLVHIAVAEAFIPNPNNCTMVKHIDGNTSNDIVSNLEWIDGKDQECSSELNNYSIYTTAQVERACQLLSQSNLSQTVISVITGIDNRTLSDIYRRKRWSNISSQYEFRTKKWTPEIKSKIKQMIIDGNKPKVIFDKLNIDYDQSAISLYERLRRELKNNNQI